MTLDPDPRYVEPDLETRREPDRTDWYIVTGLALTVGFVAGCVFVLGATTVVGWFR